MLFKAKQLFDKYCGRLLDLRNSIIESRGDETHIKPHLVPGIKLTEEEKKLIQKKWGGIIPWPIRRGYKYYLGLKCLDKFDANYLPNSFYFPYIERALNPVYWKQKLTHKGMIQLVCSAGINHPVTLLRTYGGVLMDSEYRPILSRDIRNIISKSEQPLLFKPATDSVQGDGIKLFHPDKFEDLIQYLEKFQAVNNNSDFVVQKVVEQSNETAVFNQSSLNCMRITTLHLNGKVSVCSRALKCGSSNSFVDNIGGGKGGVIVGVSDTGRLNPHGFYGNGEKAFSHNGISFDGYQIMHFHKVESAAKELHKYINKCKIIGWDIGLDSTNNPVLIEGNVVYPGISLEQMCSGPIFGYRTEEVIDYISNNRNSK